MNIDESTLDSLIGAVRANNDKLECIISKLTGGEVVLVSCNEAARLLGVTPPTITNMIRRHRLTKVTIGNSTGIRLSDIRSIIKPL